MNHFRNARSIFKTPPFMGRAQRMGVDCGLWPDPVPGCPGWVGPGGGLPPIPPEIPGGFPEIPPPPEDLIPPFPPPLLPPAEPPAAPPPAPAQQPPKYIFAPVAVPSYVVAPPSYPQVPVPGTEIETEGGDAWPWLALLAAAGVGIVALS